MSHVGKLALVLDDLARLDTIRKAVSDNDPRGQFAALGMQEVLISDQLSRLWSMSSPATLQRATGQPARVPKCG